MVLAFAEPSYFNSPLNPRLEVLAAAHLNIYTLYIELPTMLATAAPQMISTLVSQGLCDYVFHNFFPRACAQPCVIQTSDVASIHRVSRFFWGASSVQWSARVLTVIGHVDVYHGLPNGKPAHQPFGVILHHPHIQGGAPPVIS